MLVESIESSAFLLNTFVETITGGTALKTIGDYAFYGSEKLQSIVLSTTVEMIGKRAFGRCKELIEIVLPETIERIESEAFKLSGLQNVLFEGNDEPTVCKINAFDSTNIDSISVLQIYQNTSFCGEKI